MSTQNFEPGAAKYGNFIDYYKFNPSCKRFELLPCEFWKLIKFDDSTIVCLDVGCNTGELSSAIYGKLSDVLNSDGTNSLKMLGIDIDQTLIDRAQELNCISDMNFICTDIMDDNFNNIAQNFLKPFSRDTFNIVFLFSITMWIHLNYGDDGLKKVLSYLAKSSDFILLEAQPWKCYKSAVRRMRKYKMDHFPQFHLLKFRESVVEDIDDFLSQECNMVKVYESRTSHWNRKIKLFKKIK